MPDRPNLIASFDVSPDSKLLGFCHGERTLAKQNDVTTLCFQCDLIGSWADQFDRMTIDSGVGTARGIAGDCAFAILSEESKRWEAVSGLFTQEYRPVV